MMAALNQHILTANCIVSSSEEFDDLYCTICTFDERSEDWQKHIDHPRHVTTLQRFHLTFKKLNSTAVLCKICSEPLVWDAIKKHAEWHKIAPWYKPDDWSKKFFAYHFFEWKKQFYCYPCDKIFLGWYAALIHISDEKHIRSMETEVKYDGNSIPLVRNNLSYESLIQDGLAPEGVSVVRCRICDTGNICLMNVRQHLNGKKHTTSKKKIIDILNDRKNRETRENGGSQSRIEMKESTKKQENVVISTDNQKTKISSVSSSRIFPCDYIVKSSNKKRLLCKICDLEFLDYSGVENHLGGQIHASALKKYRCEYISLTKNGDHYRCECCNCLFQSCETLSDHVRGKKHTSFVNALDKREKKIEVSSTPSVSEIASGNYVRNCNMSCDYIARIDDVFHQCKICDLEIAGSRTIEEHRAGKRHAAALQKYGCLFIVREGGDYYCKCCDCKVPGIENVYLHVRGRRHDEELNNNGRRNIVLKNGHYYCECCECKISGWENVFGHINGARHSSSLKVSEDRAVERNNNNPPKATIVEKSELKVLIHSLTGQLARLLNDTEVPKTPKTEKKPRAKRVRQKNVPIVFTSCEVCNASVAGSAELHIHLAQHYSEGIAKITNNTSKNDEIQQDDESNSKNDEIQQNDESNSESKENQSFDFSDNNVTNDCAESMLGTCSDKDENSSLPEQSSIVVSDAVIDSNNPTKKKRSSKKVKKRKIVVNADDIDRIYDSGEKMKEFSLSLKLSLIIDSENIYCLVCQKSVENTLEDYYEHSCTPKHREYLDILRKDDALFASVPEQFSALRLANEYIVETSDDAVRCLICDKEEKNIEKSLRNHINGESHKKSREAMRAQAKRNFEEIATRIRCDWYNIKKYWCVPCSARMESDDTFVKHLKNPQHVKISKKIDDYENQLIYDGCACCALLWYGDRSIYVEHCKDPSHKWLKRDGYYLSPSLPKIAINLLITLEDYIENRIAYFEGVSSQEREKENTLFVDLENTVKSKFSHAKVYPFGSRISGLGSTDSDIDVFLDCGSYRGDEISKKKKLEIMKEVEKCLKENSQSWDVEEVLPNCRIPLMKVHHIATGLFCDISFENGLSVENTKLIKCFIDTYPLCRRMILFLKEWLKFCDLSGSQRITSYALCWCVIFYLQKETILPSIATLIAMKNKSHIIAGWEVGVTHEFSCNVTENNFGITELLVRFFTFYAHFDYRYDVACPLLGDVVKKCTFAKVQNLPKEMVRYIAYAKNSANGEPFRVDSAMCIQDPFDLSHNLTKAVDKVIVNRFRTFCSKSVDVLRSSGVS